MPKPGFRRIIQDAIIDASWALIGLAAIVVFFRANSYTLVDYSILLAGLILILIALGNNTIVRHYDKYLKNKILNSPLIDTMVINTTLPFSNQTVIKFKSTRLVVCYVCPVLFPKLYKRNKALVVLFGDFDFASKATLFERIVAGAITGVIMAYFVLAVIYIYQLIAS